MINGCKLDSDLTYSQTGSEVFEIWRMLVCRFGCVNINVRRCSNFKGMTVMEQRAIELLTWHIV
jgi:hypothetical protein